MIRVGIDINEILRARFMQFERYYYLENEDYLAEDEEPNYIYDIFNNYKWEDSIDKIKYLKENAPEDISPIDYQVDENGVSKADSLLFDEKKEFVSAIEKYNKFMFEDYNYEIHGAAPTMYKDVDVDLSRLIKEHKGEIEFIALSKENYLSAPPTLYFLGKNQFRFKKIILVNNVSEMWDNCDVLLTTDPELLSSDKPEDKKLIKVIRPYNEKIESKSDLEIFQIKELISSEFLNKIKE